MDYSTHQIEKSASHSMGDVSDVSLKSTSHARDRFLSNNNSPSIPISGVRPFIYQSWQRSVSEGIKSEQFSAPIIESRAKVKTLRHNNKELCRAARGAFAQIGKMLSDSEAMLILTDCTGVVIDTIGDKSTLEYGRKINLEIGGRWSENASGTNGIGTALWTGQPVFVHGTEHFCEGMRSWSCAAAPIRDPMDQSIVGVVDLSGLTTIFQKHNAAFAVAAAGEIQGALAYEQNMQRARLLEAVIGKVPLNSSGGEGLVVVDRLGRLIFTRNFEKIMLANGTELDLNLGRRFMKMSIDMSDEDILSSLPDELECTEIQHLKINGEVKGTALVFLPQNSRRHYHSKSTKLAEPGVLIMGTDLKIVGKSEPILEALDSLQRIANVNTPTLIEGETGVGKELFARFIHSKIDPSGRKPFMAINCGATSQKMFVDMLYGRDHDGVTHGGFKQNDAAEIPEIDNGGILCLDEIGELPLNVQPSFLRALEDQRTVSGNANPSLPINFRLISMTNRILREEVEAGRFRSDLYYRIGAVTLKIPPLRVRGEDILLIANYFNIKISIEVGCAPLVINSEVQDILMAYPWPGNIRELRNVIGRLHYLAKSRYITKEDLPPEILTPTTRFDTVSDTHILDQGKAESFKQAEKNLILQAISKHEGNLSKAAETLGISRPTLYRKIDAYSIERTYK